MADRLLARCLLEQAAAIAFDAGGPTVSLDEIARRAGVGPGTVHRHFPTKAALIDATIADRVDRLAGRAAELGAAADPTAALCRLFTTLVVEGAASHALADRLRSDGGDIDGAVARPLAELRAASAALLQRAREAGGIRPDLDQHRFDALVAAAHAALTHPHGDEDLVELIGGLLLAPPF